MVLVTMGFNFVRRGIIVSFRSMDDHMLLGRREKEVFWRREDVMEASQRVRHLEALGGRRRKRHSQEDEAGTEMAPMNPTAPTSDFMGPIATSSA